MLCVPFTWYEVVSPWLWQPGILPAIQMAALSRNCSGCLLIMYNDSMVVRGQLTMLPVGS